MPRPRAVSTNAPLISTQAYVATASSIGKSMTSRLAQPTIRSNFPAAIRSTAWTPKTLAIKRSRGDGIPPRWICPSTVTRVSISPCLDTLYIKLKKEELEEMTDREYQYFLLKDEACMRYKDTQQVIQSQQSAAFFPTLLAVCAIYYLFFMWVFG